MMLSKLSLADEAKVQGFSKLYPSVARLIRANGNRPIRTATSIDSYPFETLTVSHPCTQCPDYLAYRECYAFPDERFAILQVLPFLCVIS